MQVGDAVTATDRDNGLVLTPWAQATIVTALCPIQAGGVTAWLALSLARDLDVCLRDAGFNMQRTLVLVGLAICATHQLPGADTLCRTNTLPRLCLADGTKLAVPTAIARTLVLDGDVLFQDASHGFQFTLVAVDVLVAATDRLVHALAALLTLTHSLVILHNAFGPKITHYVHAWT